MTTMIILQKKGSRFLLWSMLLAIISCSPDQFHNDPQNSTDIPVSIYNEIHQTVHTRVNDSGFCDQDAVGIYVVNYNEATPGALLLQGNQADNVRFTFNEETAKWIPEYTIYYKDKNTNVDIIGYYPYDDPTSVNEYPFEIKYDQRTTASEGIMGTYEASDFLWSKATNVTPTTSQIPLIFRHIMSCVKVELVEGTGFVEGEWLTLRKEVLISNIKRNSLINLSTGVVNSTGDIASTGIIPYKDGNYFRAIVVPQPIPTQTALFSITIDGLPYIFERDDTFTYLSGKMHTFTITVSKKSGSGYEIELTADSITAWETDPITHDAEAREYVIIHCNEAGSLESNISNEGYDATQIKNLKLTGVIDTRDFQFMNQGMTKLSALNLKEVTISSPANQIPAGAFNDKISLTRIVFPDKLIKVNSQAFSRTGLSGTLVLPEGLKEIGDYAFSECLLTGTLSLPNSLEIIDNGAFNSCQYFSGNLQLSENLSSVGAGAFSLCTGFTGQLILPESLTFIGNSAFSNCTGFTGSLKIPRNIQIVSGFAFFMCTGLNGQLSLPNNLEIIESEAFCYCRFRGELHLPESLISIGSRAFESNQFSGTLLLPSNLKILSEDAFAFNNRISGTIFFPINITNVATGAFRYCSNIQGVVLHKFIDVIGSRAFENCFYINSIISESTNPPNIGSQAFDGVPKDNFTVQVPQSSISLYQTTPGWNDFKRFSAYKDFSISRNLIRTLKNSYERELIVRAPSEETWEVTSKPDWVTVNMMEGTGKQTLSVTINELPQGSPDRNGEIVIALNSTDFSLTCSVEQYDYAYTDGDVYTKQSATVGDGVNLVFMGDGYDAKDISEGKYLSDLEDAIGHFFNVEPYYSYKDYFNVYIVFGMSDDSGIGSVNTIKDTKFGAQYTLSGVAPNDATCFSYACKAPINNDVSTSLVTLVINTPDYGGMCYMWGDGSAIACCPVSADPYPYDFRGLVQHEAGGHGFGKLADEYIYVNAFISSCACPYPHLVQFNEMKNCGFYKNLSSTASFYDVPWSHLIFHPTYSNIVDIYEGGFYHSRGIFRSEPNSCMNNNIPYYSAISRQAIVERIMDYAGLPFDIDAFYANDVLDASLGTKTEIYPQTVPYYPIQTQYPPKYMGYKPVF